MEERTMNADQVKGQWRVLKGKIREQWRRLIDDHLKQINGRLEALAGRNQQTYEISMGEADRQTHEWRRSLEANQPDSKGDSAFDVMREDGKVRSASSLPS